MDHAFSLSDFVPGEPWGLEASRAAAELAPALLDAFGVVYGVERWDLAAFRRHVLEGALAEWKGAAEVRDDGGTLRVASPRCPLMPGAMRDPRLCHACRLTQLLMLQAAGGQAVQEAGFERLVTKGDDVCELVVRTSGRA